MVFEDASHHRATLRVTDRSVVGRMKFKIAVPAKTGQARHGKARRLDPSYVSPYTQGITITTTGGPTLETITLGLNAIASGCTQQFGGLTCTVILDLQPCPSASGACYSADITAYDAYDPTTNTIPPGAAALSVADDVAFSVVANQTSTLNFALSGIPAKLAVTAADSTSTVSGGTITLTGIGTHPFFANAYDADDNPITGSGAPLFAITASPAPAVTLTTPPPGSPRFSVTPLQTVVNYSSTVGLTLTATYSSSETDACSQSGATCEVQYSMSVPPPVTEYSIGTTPAYDIVPGPNDDLWFTTGNGIGSITTAGVVTLRAGVQASLSSLGITAGPDGDLWFTEVPSTGVGTGAIGKMTTDGTITEFSAGIPANHYPVEIAVGPDRNLWFTLDDVSIGEVGQVTTAGAITTYDIYPVFPIALAAGPDGNLWFTVQFGPQATGPLGVAKMTTAGTVTTYSSGFPQQCGPYSADIGSIVAGPDGNMWFTACDSVSKITTAGVVTTYPGPSPPSGYGYTAGLTVGPDGNLWFTAIGSINRMTTSGALTEFPFANAVDGLGAIASGADGNIWFIEGNGIGKLRFH